MKNATLPPPGLAVVGVMAMAALGVIALREGQVLLAAQAGVVALLLAGAALWWVVAARRPQQPVEPFPLEGGQEETAPGPGLVPEPAEVRSGMVSDAENCQGEAGPGAGAAAEAEAEAKPAVAGQELTWSGGAVADVVAVPPPPLEEVPGEAATQTASARLAPPQPAPAPAQPAPVPTQVPPVPSAGGPPSQVSSIMARLESYQNGNLQSVITVPVRIRISVPPLRR